MKPYENLQPQDFALFMSLSQIVLLRYYGHEPYFTEKSEEQNQLIKNMAELPYNIHALIGMFDDTNQQTLTNILYEVWRSGQAELRRSAERCLKFMKDEYQILAH